MPFSKSAIDALGKRLARAPEPTPADLELLAQYRDEFRPIAANVEQVLGEELGLISMGSFNGVPVTVAQRPAKTFSTLIEKLRRPGSNLSSIQDIAGFRIVGSTAMTLSKQNELRDVIVARFEGAKVDDRRLNPSAGYRAIHVIPVIDGRRIEIQLRTHLQDAWANATEANGDRWGRWLRYGLPPVGPPALIPFMVWYVEASIRLSDLWYAAESALDQVKEANSAIERGDHLERAELKRLERELVDASRRVEEQMTMIRTRVTEELGPVT